MIRRAAALVVLLAACGGGSSSPDALSIDTAPSFDATHIDGAPDAPVADAGPVVLTSGTTFTSAIVGTMCGLGWDHDGLQIWVYQCNGTELLAYSPLGAAAGSLPRPGESADDFDITFAPEVATIGTNAVLTSQMIVINGETNTADLYFPETVASTPLATAFGVDHVVGGSYHAARDTFFVVEDRNGVTTGNTIAELDRVTGAVVNSFSTLPHVDVNYGDVEVCQATGHLFVVSNIDSNLTELTPTGELVGKYPLPDGVTSLSGLGLPGNGSAWVGSTSGGVHALTGVPCGP